MAISTGHSHALRLHGAGRGAAMLKAARSAQSISAAMDVADRADRLGFRKAASAAYERAADLCTTQRDELQVAKTADFLGYKAAANHAYDRVIDLPASSDLE